MRCKICGFEDALRSGYDERRKELTVWHPRNVTCKRQPVDKEGRPLPNERR